jgi:hypothetical protein
MGEDFGAAPVRILLSVRYANGIVITYGARALSFDDLSVRILSSEELESGIQVSISAPFLEGLVPCWVASISRNEEYPGSYEQELKFYEKVVPLAMRKRGRAADDASYLLSPEDVIAAAQELASLLESGEIFPFSRVVQGSPPKRRLLYCAVSAVALMLLLQDKAIVDLKRVMEAVNRVDRNNREKGGEK